MRFLKQPVEFSESEIVDAFFRWRAPVDTTEAERRRLAGHSVTLKLARQALQISTGELASRLNIARSTMTRFEAREVEGSLSIKDAREIAAAMDCEFEYTVRPKDGGSFIQSIWKALLAQGQLHPATLTISPRPGVRLGRIVNELFRDSKFRKKMRWSRLVPDVDHGHLSLMR